jgi:isopentenyl-diphosphate delta-isomerase
MSERKKDHIQLAFKGRMYADELDSRFNYEPLLSGHPNRETVNISFMGKSLKAPIWVSSMTGGTEKARHINSNLARACKEFGLGMGLGSCRTLLNNDDNLKDFDFREIIGNELPFWANLGISQVEELLMNDELGRIEDLAEKLRADGLIIHINPLQEWLQPEGDMVWHKPIDVIERILERSKLKIMVKEVGQGMGPESLLALLKLPLEAIEFAAFGGTNFPKIEMMRSKDETRGNFYPLAFIGHTAEEMVEVVNKAVKSNQEINCRQIIISGGITTFLDGYYLINRIRLPAIYGQASAFLRYAQGPYDHLQEFVKSQIDGLKLAGAYLKIKH